MEEEILNEEVVMDDENVDIEGLIDGDNIADTIDSLKNGRIYALPDISKFKKEYEVMGHAVFDTALRKDKKVTRNEKEETVKINRIGLPLQKKIVGSAVSFTFGNPINLNSDIEDEDSDEAKVLKALKRIDYDNKMASFNRKVGKDMGRCTEVAECWYIVPVESHESYGFPAEFKTKVMLFSPWNGDTLYPFFDGTGDMLAFSREYSSKNLNGEERTYFETYTAKRKVVWRQDSELEGGWKRLPDKSNPFGKIPVIYGRQIAVEWADVQSAIERLETLVSNFAETNDYHAAPKIYFEGKVDSVMQKGDSGGLIQGQKGSKAYYLSWEHAPESVKLEIETLLRFVHGFTQTPDISFDSVKGLHQISGEAIKMLFMDAHLKVMDKREIYDEYLQRRVNLQKVIVGNLNKSLSKAANNLEVTPEIVPFIINDDTTLINNLMAANGSKPILSQKRAVEILGWASDAKEELEQIQQEEDASNSVDIFESNR